MTRNKIYTECVSRLTRNGILKESERNGEFPFGYVIDYLKDNYGLAKIEGWEIATDICVHFGLQ